MNPHAAVDFLCDSTTGAVVDDAWCHAARADGITQVRAAVQANAQGVVHWPLVAQGAAAWARAGVGLDGVFAYEYLPPFQDAQGTWHYPNEPVGTGTYRLYSAYTERFRLQLQAHYPALHAAGLGGVYIGNEPNVALALPGDNCPPGTRLLRDPAGRPLDKPLDQGGVVVDWHRAARVPDPTLNRSVLAPEETATLWWQTGQSLGAAGCPRRIAGALNVNTHTGLDATNPYFLGFLGRIYAHLAACGVHPNWSHLGLTVYGYWSVAQAQHLHDVLTAFMAAHGDHAQLIVAEVGARNGDFSPDSLYASLCALEMVFGHGNVHYFSRPGLFPYLGPPAGYLDFGWRQWFQHGPQFLIGADYQVGPTVRRWLAT